MSHLFVVLFMVIGNSDSLYFIGIELTGKWFIVYKQNNIKVALNNINNTDYTLNVGIQY